MGKKEIIESSVKRYANRLPYRGAFEELQELIKKVDKVVDTVKKESSVELEKDNK